MRSFLLILSALLLLPAADLHAREKPNVLVILADDLGFADLGFQGCKDIPTPHIDSLVKNGVQCTNGYVSCPVCSPTRAGFLTGRYQQRFGHEFNPALVKFGGKDQGLPLSEKTIADLMRAAGYRTALLGKWHQGEADPFHPLARGFDDFFGFLTGAHGYLESDDPDYGPLRRNKEAAPLEGYFTDMLGKEAVNFIDRNKDRPFFVYMAFNAVHTPMHAPEKTKQQFAHIQDENRRTYAAMLKHLDDAVGTILAKLRELNLEEDTLIFFLSDNGGPTTKFSFNGSRNHPLRGSKGDTWDGGIHVPFVVQWKGKLPAGKTFAHPVIALDILPTSLAVAGTLDAQKIAFDGVNLIPHLQDRVKTPPHDALYWRFGSQMAIRKGDWVLVRPSQGTLEYENIAVKPMLYNLKTDVGQDRDLSSQDPDRVRELQADWDRWNATLMAPRWPATLKGAIFKAP